MELGLAGLALVAIVFAAAGFVKGVVGFGLPTISMGLLGVALAPDLAAAILIVPTFLTNIWQAFAGPHALAVLRRLWPMFAGLFLGTVTTAGIIAGADSRLAVALIGGMLIVYAALGLSGVRFRVPRRSEIVAGPVAGLTTGLINGATAIFVLPSTPYLQSTDLGRDELIQALGFAALFASSALALGFGLNRSVDSGLWPTVVVALIAAVAGMTVGQVVRGRLSVAAFQKWVFVGLAGLGCAMIFRLLV